MGKCGDCEERVMGVYINMEMPQKTYAHCMLIKDLDGSVQLHICTKTDEMISEWEFYDLVPVPPHGRCVDADALKDKWTHKDLDLFSQGWGWLRDLNQAPTIIPASEEGEDED